MIGRSLARGLVAAVVIAVAAPPVFALDPKRAISQYVQSVWRIEEGLPHNSVRAVHQTRDGYLWLGTYSGLARFDGVRFKVYDTGNSALTNNEIRAIHEDAGGLLWVGTTSGGLYRLEKGHLYKDDRPIGSQTINAILSTRDGALFVGTGSGLYRMKAGQVDRFGADNGLRANTVHALVESEDGRLLIGTEGGVNILRNGELSPGPEPSADQKRVFGMLIDREGSLYVAGDRLDRFDASLRRTLSLAVPLENAQALFQDRDGIVWVGLYGAGIARLENDRLNMFRQQDGFLDRRAWSIAGDREGGLWIGTRGGLAQFRDGAAISFSTAEGFAGDIGRSVFEDADGTLYFGFSGGLSRLKGGRVENLDLGPKLRGAVVRGLMRDDKGRFWIGTDQGVAEETSPGRYRIYGLSDGLPPGGRFVLQDRKKRMWITSNAGLRLLVNGRIVTPDFVRDLDGRSIESLFEDRSGTLWVGTLNHGAWRVVDDRLEQVPLLGLVSIGVRSFFEDESGALFIGTIGSGLFIRAGEQDFRQLTTREGLGDDSIWSILDDRKGQLWMLSDRGVFRASISELLAYARGERQSIQLTATVGTAQGLKSRECNGGAGPSGFMTRDGRILAPTGAGVAIIDPRRLAASTPPPPPVIEEVVVDRAVISDSGDARVPAGGRDTEIRYTGLSFTSPASMRFRYRLEPHDRDWVEAGTRRAAYYGGLAPGRYTFRVAASNDSVSWSTQESSITLTVGPCGIRHGCSESARWPRRSRFSAADSRGESGISGPGAANSPPWSSPAPRNSLCAPGSSKRPTSRSDSSRSPTISPESRITGSFASS
jgi:ligand-binding sensor domain-containing protein